jgi:hypothetical protein
MTENEIKGLFSYYGQFVTGKDYALLKAIEAIVASKRTWVGLTDEDITEIDQGVYPTWRDKVQAIEAKLKEKNK